ncbi:putative membrane protein [Mycolicibacterium hassiacum DSM 44199]|uniref:Putative membrane protein n=1 Tax=Mycolicibacterium hassiacum (strain DSM 44199 / CIP 105218 / JCM 12690 / 3849) TaxID=1122247 RepID=K5BH45_MYCHD|nr:putative holin [Mycolicibacterium hassiacum]EKF25342.1 putative membrane protein [Mycolicibacterium hassiacum DSM 44199]MBX5489477.1 putative holin [Mycolicibacterium hassiacum]MDA4085680.1 hypothetical protein [Mycolicibacterium hassiacum DSM 44199]VCT93077.1 hypothetical protein MHAS_04815 [Mycolicibacterium hassiacum DSM 44199]
MIPLPRPWALASALLLGTAVGLIVGIGVRLAIDVELRPDVVIALVVGVPGGLGLLTVLCSNTRWATAFGAFLLAVAPGWFGVLVAIQAVQGV